MEFFKNIDAMQVQGDWVICIKQSEPGKMTVSIVFKNDHCGDNARKLIPPLVFTDKTPTELDGKLFSDLNNVIPETAKLFSNMENYLKQREEARKRSQVEKDKAEEEKKAKEAQKKKFDEVMKIVEQLEKDNKFKEAWAKVPEPSAFPEYAEELSKRRRELSAKFPPDLFSD